MDKVVLIYYKDIEEHYKNVIDMIVEVWESKNVEVILFPLSSDESDAEQFDLIPTCDYICSLDLAGFQYGTVIDGGSRYNSRIEIQLHIVLNEAIFEVVGSIIAALNLYVFVPSRIRGKVEKNNDILNLIGYRDFNTSNGIFMKNSSNKMKINEMIQFVMHEKKPDLY